MGHFSKIFIVTPLLAILLTIGTFFTKAHADALEPFIGEVQCGGYNFCPSGWAACEGQLLPISQNTALFSLLGTMYGGDGRSTFALPDLRGRVMMHQGQGTGLTNRSVGEIGGDEFHQLSQSELPAHSHTMNSISGPGDTTIPSSKTLWSDSGTKIPPYSAKTPTSQMLPSTLATGSSTPYSIMKPYLVIKCCIATQGVFPPRP